MSISRTPSTAFSITPTFYTIDRELNFTLSARARAGFGTERFLGYVTGGGVYGDIDYTFRTGNTANSFTLSEPDDEDDFGYQVGGGAEFRVTENLTFGAEYLYTRFENQDVRVRVAGATPPNPFVLVNPNGTDFALPDDDFDYHTVKAGLNFRF